MSALVLLKRIEAFERVPTLPLRFGIEDRYRRGAYNEAYLADRYRRVTNVTVDVDALAAGRSARINRFIAIGR